METEIRDAREADLDRILEIEQECFSGPEGLTRSQLRTLHRNRDAHFMVAKERDGGSVAGFAIHLMDETIARLITIDVSAAKRRNGIGRFLLRGAEERALRGGALKMVLEVRESNSAALALYKSAGYKPVGEIPNYYFYPVKGSRKAIAMEKKLRNR
ncbi:MAG: ribosomal protein S18-alanine N-acetyltransferase [Euryarchaeota archaeon]|nr:ribosomal protein S18-alanine N-acetyltransferase [Euryarchaeota archaeon]